MSRVRVGFCGFRLCRRALWKTGWMRTSFALFLFARGTWRCATADLENPKYFCFASAHEGAR